MSGEADSPRRAEGELSAQSAAGEQGSWISRHRGKLLLSLLIGGAFVWLLNAGALPIVPKADALAGVRWWTFGVYLGLWCVVHWIRAVRWQWLLAPLAEVPRRRVIDVSFIGFLAIVLLPFRSGEMVRPVMIRRKGTLSGWAATGTIAAERVIDGLVLTLMLWVALLVSEPLDPLPDKIGELPIPASVVPAATYAALVLFGGAFVAMGLFFAKRELARRLVAWSVAWLSPRLADWLSERVEKVASGLSFLPRARETGYFVAATLAYWLLNAAAGWVLAWGAGLTGMTFWHSAVVTGVLALGILLPNAPGFFGAFQVSVYAALAIYFQPEVVTGAGSAYVFLLYVGQLLVTAGAAVWALSRERTSFAEAIESEATDLDEG